MAPETAVDARALFGGIAPAYDVPAELLSFGLYRYWRRTLVRTLPLPPGARVLDVAAGTGLISRELSRRKRARVTALDLTPAMLRRARVRAESLVAASATTLPFADATFDGLTFSYLLRYVEDPSGTLAELARVVRRGGAIGSVEFGVPAGRVTRAGWRAYARGIFPAAARAFGPGWAEVGRFLPRSIERWARAWPLERQLRAWDEAGLTVTHARRLSFGAGVVVVGRRT